MEVVILDAPLTCIDFIVISTLYSFLILIIIDKLNLPVRVTRGHLSSLQVKIPWTALGSKPVQVKLQGIYLQAEPVDIVKLSTEELRKENFLLKRSLLKQAEDAVIESIKESQTGGDFTENASYLQLLVAKIVANIEILVEDVHIRYQFPCSLVYVVTYFLSLLLQDMKIVKLLLVNALHLVSHCHRYHYLLPMMNGMKNSLRLVVI